ncbi:hypothetical protein DAEQUDRAFT_665359 [Daedalea quercina L-15889]|uniref:Uncharacterized protein n=1 Tax=Daedalea quercina L-15889 TaxID=1314783 RepID=A0A165SDH7_9APHY|nr:hypothetical protein DAEQUDRAFT_665359 [Daedalea quercina L-15889]
MASSRRPLLMASNATPSSTLRSRRAPSRTEPLSLGLSLTGFTSPDDLGSPSTSLGSGRSVRDARAVLRAEEHDSRPSLLLSKAVVVSGLEHASLQAQRTLSQVLAQRKLVLDDDGGTWNLADDFIMVYVCKADPHERPPLLRGLLDKFAMSTDITISPSARQAYAAYRVTPLPTPHGSPFPTAQALPSHTDYVSPPPARTPTSRSTPLPSFQSASQSHSTAANPVISATDLAVLRALASPTPSAEVHAYTSIHPSLTAYIRDLFAATRHHPVLDGTSLTHQAHSDAEALARAFRVLAGDSLGMNLVHVAVELEQESSGTEHSGSTHAESLNAEGNGGWEKEVMGMNWAAPQGVPRVSLERREDENTPLNVDLPYAPDDGQPALTPTLGAPTPAPAKPPEVWDVSEVDVARIFPRVVSHRLRVRDGPDDEILGSVMYPAVSIWRGASAQQSKGVPVWERRTVKDVLVEILADV